MKHFFRLLFFIFLITSCLNHNDDANLINKKICISEDINTANNCQASIENIEWFFNIKKREYQDSVLYFFENNDSIIRWDINKLDWTYPIMSIGVDNEDLEDSRFLKLENIAVLVLANHGENNVNLFIKKKENKVQHFWGDNYIPTQIVLNQLNDTLVVCELYWEYLFGPAIEDVRIYYFIGEKTGVFKYGYNSSRFLNSPLDIENYVLRDNGILFKDKKHNDTLLVLPDTVKLLNSSNTDFVFWQPYSSFNSVNFKFNEKKENHVGK